MASGAEDVVYNLDASEALFSAAERGNLDKLNAALARGADPSWPNPDRVRVVAEDGRAPPHPLCGLVPRRDSAVRLSVASSSLRPRASSGSALRRVVAARIGRRGRESRHQRPYSFRGSRYTHPDPRVNGGRGLGAHSRDDADGDGLHSVGVARARERIISSTAARHGVTMTS